MISDEMRELLSAYVDGELRDADAARVEDVSKRDPELRREIEAYRTLRRKLREWDAAEHGAAPDPALKSRALDRARAIDAALAVPVRRGFLAPLAMAATILVALGVGYFLARSTAPEAPSVPISGTHVAVQPLGPAPDVALKGSALAPVPAPGQELVRARIDDHLPSRRAVELELMLRHEELVVKAPTPPETRSVTPVSAEVKSFVEGAVAHAAPRESLVYLMRPSPLTGIPSVEPTQSGRHACRDLGNREIFERPLGANHVLAPLGEVWAGKDGRTRLVALSDWISPKEDMLVKVVWGDATAASKSGESLDILETILGPKARRRLLSAQTGSDADFLAWLKETYGAEPLPALLANVNERERAMNKLVDSLRADMTATGFAVVDAKGAVLGVEMFHDHAAMLAFAPRLLRGYLIEAGDDGLRVTPPSNALGLEKVKDMLKALPERGLRVEKKPLEDQAQGYGRAPKGLCRVTLVGAAGQIAGHGLVVDDSPIHLTLFAE